MARRFVGAALMALVTMSAVVSADEGATAAARNRPFKPIWTLAGIGAGFGAGLWAGLSAFDDSTNSDRKVWTTALVGAAAGGILGYLVDRHRAKPHVTTQRQLTLVATYDEHRIVSASRGFGGGQLKRWLEGTTPAAEVSSVR
jgi:hypothetical protein